MGLIWLEFSEPEFVCANCQGLILPHEIGREENRDYTAIGLILNFCGFECRAEDRDREYRRNWHGGGA